MAPSEWCLFSQNWLCKELRIAAEWPRGKVFHVVAPWSFEMSTETFFKPASLKGCGYRVIWYVLNVLQTSKLFLIVVRSRLMRLRQTVVDISFIEGLAVSLPGKMEPYKGCKASKGRTHLLRSILFCFLMFSLRLLLLSISCCSLGAKECDSVEHRAPKSCLEAAQARCARILVMHSKPATLQGRERIECDPRWICAPQCRSPADHDMEVSDESDAAPYRFRTKCFTHSRELNQPLHAWSGC